MSGATYIVDAVRTPFGRYGGALAAAICIGVGQGLAVVIEA